MDADAGDVGSFAIESYMRDGFSELKNTQFAIMRSKQKVLYEAPSTMVYEVESEGVICTSDPKYKGMGDEEEM